MAYRKQSMTFKQLASDIRALGLRVHKTGYDDEVKVSIPGQSEASGYFTDDWDDALETARIMSQPIGTLENN